MSHDLIDQTTPMFGKEMISWPVVIRWKTLTWLLDGLCREQSRLCDYKVNSILKK